MPRNVQTDTLKWIGDSLIDSGRPARIAFECADGTCRSLPLRDALAQAEWIDARGLQRVVSALDCSAARDELVDDDMIAWLSVRDSVLALMAIRAENLAALDALNSSCTSSYKQSSRRMRA